MSEKHEFLPWLQKLAVQLPGYTGYRTGAYRRGADQALRAAIAGRLMQARGCVEQALQRCRQREAVTECNGLERVIDEINRLAARVRNASAGVDEFYAARDFRPAKADALHAVDHAMLELAGEFVEMTKAQMPDHDWLACVESGVERIERRLDDRARLHEMAAK